MTPNRFPRIKTYWLGSETACRSILEHSSILLEITMHTTSKLSMSVSLIHTFGWLKWMIGKCKWLENIIGLVGTKLISLSMHTCIYERYIVWILHTI